MKIKKMQLIVETTKGKVRYDLTRRKRKSPSYSFQADMSSISEESAESIRQLNSDLLDDVFAMAFLSATALFRRITKEAEEDIPGIVGVSDIQSMALHAISIIMETAASVTADYKDKCADEFVIIADNIKKGKDASKSYI